jgi:hypothetical protein
LRAISPAAEAIELSRNVAERVAAVGAARIRGEHLKLGIKVSVPVGRDVR